MPLNPSRAVALALSTTLLGIGVVAMVLALQGMPRGPQALQAQGAAAEQAEQALAEEPELHFEPSYDWYEARPGQGTHVLTTKLTIPGLFDNKVRELSIARYLRRDEQGLEYFPDDSSAPFETAHGHNDRGGFGYSGRIALMENLHVGTEPDGFVKLVVEYHWTTSQLDHGFIDQVMNLKVGEPAEIDFKHGRRLTIEWR